MTLRNWPQRIRQRADRAVRILRSPINPLVTDHDGHRNSAVVTWRSDFATFSRLHASRFQWGRFITIKYLDEGPAVLPGFSYYRDKVALVIAATPLRISFRAHEEGPSDRPCSP